MKTKTIQDMLAEVPFFEGMEASHLVLLSGCGQLARFHRVDFLLREREAANRFFLIRRGGVTIESHLPGGVLTIAKAGQDGIAGYSWLFPPYRNQFDDRAISEVETIQLDGKCLCGKTHGDLELGYQFMKRFAELMLHWMQAARRQLLDIYGVPSPKSV